MIVVGEVARLPLAVGIFERVAQKVALVCEVPAFVALVTLIALTTSGTFVGLRRVGHGR